MNKKSIRINKEYIVLSIIIIISFIARLYNINSPLADWHSWRQADTSAVTRRYVKEGINLLRPRYDDLSSIPSGIDNPQGLRFVEFPIVNALTAILFNSYPQIKIEVWGRLTSIVFSLGAVLLMYKIVSYFYKKSTGYIAALVFALLPFNLYFHRTILPEVPFIFFSLLSFYYFSKWIEKEKSIDFAISLVAGALAVLIKPTFLFMGIPMFYQVIKKWKTSFIKRKSLYLFLLLIVLPFILWRLWMAQFPEGIPASTWLLNGSKIRFRPAFFRWIFAERIGKLILGYWGIIPFAFGVVRKPNKKSGWLFHWWLVAMLAYLVIFATGNVTHDYYQVFIIPVIAIFTGLGVDFAFQATKEVLNNKILKLLVIVSIIFGFGFAWFNIRDFYNINHPEIVAAGEAADAILPSDAKVIAPYLGDTAFLYQINRQGWPIGGEIKEKIDKGATDYVTVNLDEEAKWILEHCEPAISLNQFTIISLRNCSL